MLRREILLASAGLLGIPFPAEAETSVAYFEGPGSTTLPLNRAVDGKLYLRTTVMGRDLLLFLDTGALTLLDMALARSLGLKLVDTGQSGFGLTGGAGKRISGRIEMRLGKLKITGLPVDFMDLGPLRALSRANGMPEFDGLIGAELLTTLRAKIDFERLTLTLRRPGQ
jgi:hypothetical protein